MSTDSHEGSARNAGARPRLSDLPDKLLELLRAGPAGEIEQHLKSMLAQTVDKLDLVTREEFDVQCEMVERLRVRVEQLEAKLADKQDTP